MRHLRLICLTSLCTGAGAFVGMVLGRPVGARTTMLAAMVGGTLALLVTLRFAAGRGWLHPDRIKGGSIGGLVGLGLASPLAVMMVQRPVALLAAAALVGVGVVVGAGPGGAR
jgi:hypothetical protein